MDNMIIIPINLFSLDQEIIIINQDGSQSFAKVDLVHLPEVVVEACGIYSTDSIRLIGNKNYAEALSNEISEYAAINYANKTLNIEIMEA
jgi:hypothetical protein